MIYYNGQKVVKAYLNGYVYDRNHRKRIHSPTEDPSPAAFGSNIAALIDDNNITAFLPSPTAPPSNVQKINVGDSEANPLWLWVSGTTLYYFSYSHEAVIRIPQGDSVCWAFRGHTTLETIDLSELRFADDFIFTGLFYGDTALETVVFSSQAIHPVRMNYMFTSCSSLEEIDLSTFYTDQFSTDTSNIPLYMTFDGCNSLTTVYVNADWSLSRIGTSGKTANAFGVSPSCALLIGGNGSTLTSINENKQSSEPDANRVYWARIDTPSQMGLFTLK